VQAVFGRPGQRPGIDAIRESINTAGFAPYSGDITGRLEDVAHRLLRRRERVVRDILLEEWAFLNRQSWIAARTKKTFDTFKRAGAVVIDFSGQRFDAVVSRTLHHERLPLPPALNHRHRMKAGTKWLAAGGAPTAGLIDPLLGTVAGIGTALFFLFDP
jgi:hypothetical protein